MAQTQTMTPERWQRLQALFDEALALEGEARAEFVVKACGTDVALREQLLSLIMASSSEDGFESQVDTAIASVMRNAELQPGHAIGRYRIVRLIGRGGMGAVYLAERADKEYEQQVAIKVVADGVLSSRIVARLRSERQILANLNHPNIARLLDGGATQDGTPYLAMEYVDGVRLDLYGETHKLSIAQKLKIFVQVCSAVQYAHQSLIVHRDIKASNILVTSEGVPKLLDFGIAKLVDPNATTQNLDLTRLHERVLTPSNASPEQVRGETIGTVSDVYALGVLLYELLTGLPPYSVNGLSFEQIEKLICEHTPPKPSAAVLAASKLSIPTADAALARPLHGDLDTIVMKAMHKETQRRYSSAGALADDIANYLGNRPITARPDSFHYRAGKFWRRNRWLLTSAAAVIFGVFALVGYYTWRLAIERDNAALEAAKSKQVAGFLVEMFRTADPSEAQGRQITALDILNRGAEKIDTQLANQPRVRAELSGVIGVSYRSIGEYERAQKLLENALKLKREAGLTGTLEYSQSLVELANLLRNRGDFSGSEQAFKEALIVQRARSPQLELAMTLTNFANLYYDKNRLQESLALHEEASALVRLANAEGTIADAEVKNGLGLVLQNLNEFEKAEPLLREALSIRERIEGSLHPMAMVSKMNLALFLRTTGHYREAVVLLEQLLPVRRKVLGANHPSVGILLTQLGNLLTLNGEHDRAEKYLQEALTIIESQLGRDHTRYVAVVRSLGLNEMGRGNYVAAERYLRLAKIGEIKNFGADSSQLYRTDVMVSRTLRGQAKNQEADALLEAAYAYFEKNKQADKGRLLLEMGRMRLAQYRWDEAKTFFARDLAEFEAIGGVDDPANIGPLQGLALVAMHAQDFDTAIKHSHRALDIALRKIPEARAEIAVAKSVYGAALLGAGKVEQSGPLIREGYETLTSVRPTADPIVRAAFERLVEYRRLSKTE